MKNVSRSRSWLNTRFERLLRLATLGGLPLVIAGDLNVTSWSPFYSAAFTDDFVNAREGFGVLPTWPSDFPAWMRTPIDQILLRGGLTVRSIRLGPDLESDHLPIEVVLGFSGTTSP